MCYGKCSAVFSSCRWELAGMALAHGKPWVPGDWKGAAPVFCAKSYKGEDGEVKMTKLKWLDVGFLIWTAYCSHVVFKCPSDAPIQDSQHGYLYARAAGLWPAGS